MKSFGSIYDVTNTDYFLRQAHLSNKNRYLLLLASHLKAIVSSNAQNNVTEL